MTNTALNSISETNTNHSGVSCGVGNTNIIFVNDADWNNLQQRLDNPSEPNDALKELLKRGKQLVSNSSTS